MCCTTHKNNLRYRFPLLTFRCSGFGKYTTPFYSNAFGKGTRIVCIQDLPNRFHIILNALILDSLACLRTFFDSTVSIFHFITISQILGSKRMCRIIVIVHCALQNIVPLSFLTWSLVVILFPFSSTFFEVLSFDHLFFMRDSKYRFFLSFLYNIYYRLTSIIQTDIYGPGSIEMPSRTWNICSTL